MFVDNVGGFGVDVNDIVDVSDIVDVNDIVDGPPVQVPTIIYHLRHTALVNWSYAASCQSR